MLKCQINSKKQGDVGLGDAIAYFCANSYTVCIPLTDSQDYDLVVEKDSILSRVQVKTVWSKSDHGVYRVNLKVCGGNRTFQKIKNFDSSKVDFVFVLTNDNERYLIQTWPEMPKTSINLGKEYEKFKI